MSEPRRLGGPAAHMTFTRVDGRPVLAVGRSQGIELRSAPDNEVLRVVDRQLSVDALVRLPGRDGAPELMAAGTPDGVVLLFDPATGELVAEQRVSGSEVTDLAMAVLADGTRVVAAAHDDGISLWNPNGGPPQPLPDSAADGRTRPFRICAYRALGAQWLACAYNDDSLAVWNLDAADRPLVARLPQVHEGAVWSLVAVDEPASGYVVATGSADGTIKLWQADPDNGLRQGRQLTESATVRRLRFVRDVDVPLLVSAAASGAVSLWRFDGPTDRPLRVLRRHQGEAWSLACATTAGGGVLIASGSQHGDVEISAHDTELVNDTAGRDLFVANRTTWTAVSGATANGPYVACAGVDRVIQVVDPDPELATAEFGPLAVVTPTRTLDAHSSTVRALATAGTALDPHLISGGADHRVLDWDPRTGEFRRELPMKHQGEVWALATFSLEGVLHAASGSADGSVQVCGLVGDDSAVEVATDVGGVNAVVATPHEGTTLLTVASTRGVRVVSAQGPETAAIVSRHPVSAACAMVDGQQHLVVTARQSGDASVLELVDPANRTVAVAFRYTATSSQITALAATRADRDMLIFGGLDDGQLLIWQLDGTLIGTPIQTGLGTIRALGMVDVAASDDTGLSVTRPALFAAADTGRLRLWPLAAGDLLRSGGSIGTGVRPASILLQDQPTAEDKLSREVLVDTIRTVLMSDSTDPPVVVGVHGPWGHGKSSVLRLLRSKIDSAGAAAAMGKRVAPTHHLVPRAPEPDERGRRGRPRPPKPEKKVRTSLSRAWAWKRMARAGGHRRLDYEMHPLEESGGAKKNVITVWFSPWMYESPQQVWAGLTREIINAIAGRLSVPEQERLWFDLYLRRNGSAAMRRRILASYLPRTLPGLLLGLLTVALVLAVSVAVGVAAWQTGGVQALIGSTVLLGGTALAVIVNLALKSFKQVQDWMEPDGPTRPPSEGIGGAGTDGDWRSARDPLQSSERGYLYLLQHDVQEVVDLAVGRSSVVIMVDDLDRCRPAIVADAIEAINLFLNNAFGDCHFVIALDPATVAAQLETVYESLHRRAEEDPATFGHLQRTGWRFMEKIVDLPIRLPRLIDDQIETYLGALLDTGTRRKPPPPAPAPVPSAAPASAQPPPVAEAREAGPAPAPAPPPVDVVTAIRRVDELEQLPEVRLALKEAVRKLPHRNPRQIKAFVNLWRFYMVLDDRTGQLSTSRKVVERHSVEMARFVEMMIRWPWLLDTLTSMRGEENVSSPTVLANLIDRSADDRHWAEVITAAGMDPADPTIIGLRALFRRPGMARDAFALIAARYL